MQGGVVAALTTFAAMIGLFWMLRKFKLSHYHVFAACYLLVLLLWHFPPRERFLLPVIPLLLGGLCFVIQESIKGLMALLKCDSIVSGGASLALSMVLLTFLEATVLTYWMGPWTILADAAQRRAEKLLRLSSYDFITQHLPASSAFIAHEIPWFIVYRAPRSKPSYSVKSDLQR